MPSIRIDASRAKRHLSEAAKKQLPFATMKALNTLARDVMNAERAGTKEVFYHPRPFTQRAALYNQATKANLVSRVFLRPEAAVYLAPYESGGLHRASGRGLAVLVPKNIRTDSYGQIRGRPRAIGDRPNTFAGVVQTKAGPVWGFWQRVKRPKKGGPRLKLLVRGEAPTEVRKSLGFERRAREVVSSEASEVFARALAAALRTARR